MRHGLDALKSNPRSTDERKVAIDLMSGGRGRRRAVAVDPDATLYVGHGESGGRELLATQQHYVRAFVESVAAHRHRAPDERRAAVVADMQRVMPGDDLRFLMELGVDAVARPARLTRARRLPCA